MINEPLVAVPLFIFMGIMLEKTKIAAGLLQSIGELFGTTKGGLGIGVVLVGMLLVLLLEVVAAETGFLVHLVSKVEVTGFEKAFESFLVADFREHGADRLVLKDSLGDRLDGSVRPKLGWLAFTQVKVGTAGGDKVLKVLVNDSHSVRIVGC